MAVSTVFYSLLWRINEFNSDYQLVKRFFTGLFNGANLGLKGVLKAQKCRFSRFFDLKGVVTYMPRCTQLYVQLYIQPHFKNETYTIFATLCTRFQHSGAGGSHRNLTTYLTTCKQSMPHVHTYAHGRVAPAVLLSCQSTATSPRNAVNA